MSNIYTCTIDQPCFDFLLSGKKMFEGRVKKGKWCLIKCDDKLQISTGLNGTIVEFEVIKIVNAPTFEHLYFALGDRLIPEGTDDANEYYRKWFSDEEVKEYGVVGVGLRRIIY